MFDQSACPIADVKLRPLTLHRDDCGGVCGVFRASWDEVVGPSQWSIVRSGFNVMRGVHVHLRHVDYVLSVMGRVLMGLSDLREESATFRTGCLVELSSDALAAVQIPPGVAHGFYYPGPNILLHGSSEYFDPADDLECRWNDPALNIPWPKVIDPIMSPRDRQSCSLADMLEKRRELLAATTRRQAA